MRILKRVGLTALVTLLLLIVSLAGSVLIDRLLQSGRIEALTNVIINGGAQTPVQAYVARPPGEGRHAAVIMIHDFRGMSADVNSKADLLAREGYVVIAPDTYRGSVTSWIPRAIYLVLTTPQERVNRDLDAVFAWLAEQPDVDANRIAVMGFCYGGGKSLRYSLHNPELAATSIFYGDLLDDGQMLRALPGPVHGAFGALDTAPSPANVAAFEAALDTNDIRHSLTIYPDRGHGFVESAQTIQEDPIQNRAWSDLVAFLRDNL